MKVKTSPEEKPKKRGGIQPRNRTKYTTEQLQAMENVFYTTQYPDSIAIDELGKSLGVSIERISIWFQNRRSKFKRQSKGIHMAWMRKQVFNGDSHQLSSVLPVQHKQTTPENHHVLSPVESTSLASTSTYDSPRSNLHYVPMTPSSCHSNFNFNSMTNTTPSSSYNMNLTSPVSMPTTYNPVSVTPDSSPTAFTANPTTPTSTENSPSPTNYNYQSYTALNPSPTFGYYSNDYSTSHDTAYPSTTPGYYRPWNYESDYASMYNSYSDYHQMNSYYSQPMYYNQHSLGV